MGSDERPDFELTSPPSQAEAQLRAQHQAEVLKVLETLQAQARAEGVRHTRADYPDYFDAERHLAQQQAEAASPPQQG